MPAVNVSERERAVSAYWLRRQQEAFGLPPELRSLLQSLELECPVRRGLTRPADSAVHVSRAG